MKMIGVSFLSIVDILGGWSAERTLNINPSTERYKEPNPSKACIRINIKLIFLQRI
jgi:hypothetical protein